MNHHSKFALIIAAIAIQPYWCMAAGPTWINPEFGVEEIVHVAGAGSAAVAITYSGRVLQLFGPNEGFVDDFSVRWRVSVPFGDSFLIFGEKDGFLASLDTRGGANNPVITSAQLDPICSIIFQNRLLLGCAEGEIVEVELQDSLDFTLYGKLPSKVIGLALYEEALYAATEGSIWRLDGGTWVECYAENSAGYIRSLSASNSRLLLLRSYDSDQLSNSVLWSIDGLEWAPTPSLGDWEPLASSLDAKGDLAVIVGLSDLVLISQDGGLTWSEESLLLSRPKGNWQVPEWFFARNNQLITVKTTSTDSFLVGGERGEIWSWNGQWSLLNNGTRDHFFDIIRWADIYVASGSDETLPGYESRLLWSEDLQHWNDSGVYTDGPLVKLVKSDGDGLLAVGGSLGILVQSNRARIYYSTDGKSWVPGTISISGHKALNAGTHGSLGWIVAGSGGQVFRSANGTSWTSVDSLSVTDDLLYCAYGDGRYFVASAFAVWTTVDLENWDLCYTTDAIAGIVYVRDHLEIATADGHLFAWQNSLGISEKDPLPFSPIGYFDYQDGRYGIISSGYSSTFATSSDGIEWISRSTGLISRLEGVYLSDHERVLYGEHGQIISIAEIELKYLFAAASKNPHWGINTWMGQLYDLHYPWVYHNDLGWIWCAPAGASAAWFYIDRIDAWCYADQAGFPNLYILLDNTGWYYLSGSHLWNYSSNRWEPL